MEVHRMIASVHVSDVSLSVALSAARRTSFHRSVDGLRHANLAFAAPLSPSVLPRPSLRRIVMVAIGDGDDARPVPRDRSVRQRVPEWMAGPPPAATRLRVVARARPDHPQLARGPL